MTVQVQSTAGLRKPASQLDPDTPKASGCGSAVTAVVVAAAVLSSSYTLTKVALQDLPPMTIGSIRFALAAALLAVWVHGIRKYARPAAADLRQLALGGVLGITLYFAIENLGVHLATAADAAMLVASYPALTTLLELVIYRQRTRLGGVAGIALAIMGVALVVGFAPASGAYRQVGCVLLVVSGVVWALYNFATRKVSGRYPTTVILYYQTLVGAAAFVPLALLEHRQWQPLGAPVETIAALAALTALCSVAGLGLYARGLRQLRPSTAVNLLNLVPLFGLVIAVITLGERVTVVQLVGGVVVMVGVTITTRMDSADTSMEKETHGS